MTIHEKIDAQMQLKYGNSLGSLSPRELSNAYILMLKSLPDKDIKILDREVNKYNLNLK